MTRAAGWVCKVCGAIRPQYRSRCPECRAVWSFITVDEARERGFALPIGLGGGSGKRLHHMQTSIDGFDHIASRAGGLVRGISYIISGWAGSGKSTLLLQAAAYLSLRRRVVYAFLEPGEDFVEATLMRMRLRHHILGVAGDTVEQIIERSGNADVKILDSLQALRDRCGEPVEKIAKQLTEHAHASQTTWILVGHVNKEGDTAGPEEMQHWGDALLHMSGERGRALRTLSASKNRYAPTDRIYFLQMTERGLVDVPDPASYLLADRVSGAAGSCVAATTIENGGASVLCEVQAMVTPIVAEEGVRKRIPTVTTRGIDVGRVRIIQRILTERTDVDTSEHDVIVNVVGDLKLDVDVGLDLPIALAIASAMRLQPLPPKLCAWGELGLVGEVRAVTAAKLRAAEAKRAGYEAAHGRRLADVIDATLVKVGKAKTVRKAARKALTGRAALARLKHRDRHRSSRRNKS